jgi:hypothetical protein
VVRTTAENSSSALPLILGEREIGARVPSPMECVTHSMGDVRMRPRPLSRAKPMYLRYVSGKPHQKAGYGEESPIYDTGLSIRSVRKHTPYAVLSRHLESA